MDAIRQLVSEFEAFGVSPEINGSHENADVLRLVFRPRVALVTDAIAAAGMPPGACA